VLLALYEADGNQTCLQMAIRDWKEAAELFETEAEKKKCRDKRAAGIGRFCFHVQSCLPHVCV
jgi:hypothetical protein